MSSIKPKRPRAMQQSRSSSPQKKKKPRTRSSRRKMEEKEKILQEKMKEAFIDLLLDTATSWCPECNQITPDENYNSEEVSCECPGIRDCPDCLKLSSKLRDGDVVLCENCH